MTTEKKRSKIPYIFFGFFAVIIAVNVFYVYIAKKTWHGLVTGDSYHKGLNYNENIAQAKKQKELGWEVKINYRSVGNLKAEISVILKDRNGNPIDDAQMYINFRRPSQEGFDFVERVDSSTGSYESKVTFPLKGQWDVEVVVTKGTDTFQEVKRYVIE